MRGAQHVDGEQVKAYASDLRSLLLETDITTTKSSLRSLIQKVVIHGDTGTIHYKLPVPTH